MATRMAVSADITPTVTSTSVIRTKRKNLRMRGEIVTRTGRDNVSCRDRKSTNLRPSGCKADLRYWRHGDEIGTAVDCGRGSLVLLAAHWHREGLRAKAESTGLSHRQLAAGSGGG